METPSTTLFDTSPAVPSAGLLSNFLSFDDDGGLSKAGEFATDMWGYYADYDLKQQKIDAEKEIAKAAQQTKQTTQTQREESAEPRQFSNANIAYVGLGVLALAVVVTVATRSNGK